MISSSYTNGTLRERSSIFISNMENLKMKRRQIEENLRVGTEVYVEELIDKDLVIDFGVQNQDSRVNTYFNSMHSEKDIKP